MRYCENVVAVGASTPEIMPAFFMINSYNFSCETCSQKHIGNIRQDKPSSKNLKVGKIDFSAKIYQVLNSVLRAIPDNF